MNEDAKRLAMIVLGLDDKIVQALWACQSFYEANDNSLGDSNFNEYTRASEFLSTLPEL